MITSFICYRLQDSLLLTNEDVLLIIRSEQHYGHAYTFDSNNQSSTALLFNASLWGFSTDKSMFV